MQGVGYWALVLSDYYDMIVMEVDTMLFQLNITLTEEDYLAFNDFHAFGSGHGKKLIRRSRIIFVSLMALLMALVLLVIGTSVFALSYAAFLGLFTAVYMLLYRKILARNIKAQIKRLKKQGKLPFDPVSTLEFYDDKLVEITPSKRTEQNYSTFERICIVQGKYILLYYSSVGAYILPIPQIQAQTDQDAFLRFLSGKCDTIENH